jgi:putative addiction module killer protein
VESKERRVLSYRSANGRFPYREWRNSLNDQDTEVAVDVRITRLSAGNFGDSRPIGGGVFESRIDFGPGYRIYFGMDGDEVILLCGGDKSTQDSDIARAKQHWKDYCSKYLSAAFRDSAGTFLVALRNVAAAQKGMTALAAEAGVNRENLYRMLSEDGNPRLDTLWAVLKAIGLRVSLEPSAPQLPRPR